MHRLESHPRSFSSSIERSNSRQREHRLRRSNVHGLLWLLAIVAVAAIASISVDAEEILWYEQLRRPPFAPSVRLMQAIWTVLGVLMGVAAWLVAQARYVPHEHRMIALQLMGIQLGLSAIWAPLLFSMQNLGWALVDLCALWFALVATIIAFCSARFLAAWLMVPYLGWISFTIVVNGSIWLTNR
jgi:tryptophan-rich sensory protein